MRRLRRRACVEREPRFTEEVGKVAEITTGGVITEFAVPTPAGTRLGIAEGPDGAVWLDRIRERPTRSSQHRQRRAALKAIAAAEPFEAFPLPRP